MTNMKKITYTALTAAVVLMTACSTSSHHKDTTVLPEGPRNEVETNFDSKPVGVTVESNTFGDDEYEVALADGTRIEYKGNQWTEVEAGNGKAVPDSYIPSATLAYVTSNYPGIKIIKIERNTNGFDVELANGLEIRFDTEGAFLNYDD